MRNIWGNHSLIFMRSCFVFAELVADLREAILQIARHFDAIDPKKVRTLCQNSSCSRPKNSRFTQRAKRFSDSISVFHGASKVIRDCIGFVFLVLLIGLEDLRHLFSQYQLWPGEFLFFPVGGGGGGWGGFASIFSTWIVCDCFQGLEVDYSMESHARDHERFINVARYS